jgi:two-component system chemotaxis sensor kinase CheA
LDESQLLRQLLASFVVELDEQVRSFGAELLALEKQGAAGAEERVRNLFRIAHTIKGGARAVDAPELARLAHDLEDVLSGLRATGAPPPVEMHAALYGAGDAIAAAGRALRETGQVPATLVAPAREALAQWLTPSSEAAPAVPLATPLPPDEGAPAREEHAVARVATSRLNDLLGSSGEMLIALQRNERRLEALESAAVEALGRGTARATEASARETARALATAIIALAREHRTLADAALRVDERVRRVRLLPFSEALAGIERVARDAAAAGGKKLTMAFSGEDTLLDRAVLDELRDSLHHLVRNAADHGIEPPAARLAAGKSEEGQIEIAARIAGGSVEVTVSDDGRGIDLEALRARAAERHRPVPARDADLLQLVFEAGFSTAPRVTGVSGRGVGLDVVRSRVEAMRGHVALDFTPGKGTRFRLTVPVELSTIRAVLLQAGDQVVAVPSHHVRTVKRIGLDDLPLVEGRRRLPTGGAPLPVVALGPLLGVGAAPTSAARLPLAVLETGGDTAAFVVDQLLDEASLTVKRLPARLARSRLMAGASILSDGRVALILNVPTLIKEALGHRADDLAPRVAAAQRRPRVLLVDDSLTTRGLERSILEAAGYEVVTASDGGEAWTLLHEQSPEQPFDLVVSDIEMPNVTGFELTQRVRASHDLARLPIVLVSGLASDADRARGLELGADAYVVKSAFQQSKLLETIAELVKF